MFDTAQYIAESCGTCPFCKSSKLVDGAEATMEEIKRTSVRCRGCGGEWAEIWRLVKVDVIKKP